MLLRSTSTPLLGSLISSISESPNSLNKSPYHHHQIGSLNFSAFSCNSSPISTSIAEKGLRRAQSEGNLEGLSFASCNNSYDDCHNSSQNKSSGRQKCLMLETIPSFSLCNLKGLVEEEDDDSDDWREIAEQEERIQVEANGGLSNKMEKMVTNEKMGVMERSSSVGFEGERGFIDGADMLLAKGIGIDCGNYNSNGSGGTGGGGGGYNGEFHWGGGDGGDIHGTEECYKKMVEENPGNPLFMRNYAQILYQAKGDLEGEEEYYSRAILADPKDGEILSRCANLVWELHGDKDKASSYFERAVQASPEDSHVHAAFASFLWETEEDENECNVPNDMNDSPHLFQEGVMASTGAWL